MTIERLIKMLADCGLRLEKTRNVAHVNTGLTPEATLAHALSARELGMRYDPAKGPFPTDLVWYAVSEIKDRHDGSFLLHGPALVHADFNPEGVERGYWQDDAIAGESIRENHLHDAQGQLVPYLHSHSTGPGAWCVPGWDGNNDQHYTRFVGEGEQGITHFARIPRGPHSLAPEACRPQLDDQPEKEFE